MATYRKYQAVTAQGTIISSVYASDFTSARAEITRQLTPNPDNKSRDAYKRWANDGKLLIRRNYENTNR